MRHSAFGSTSPFTSAILLISPFAAWDAVRELSSRATPLPGKVVGRGREDCAERIFRRLRANGEILDLVIQ